VALGSELTGRETTLALMRGILSQKFRGRCHILLAGIGKVGKSSVLNSLAKNTPSFTSMLVDFSQVLSTPHLFARNFFIQSLIQLTEGSVPSFNILNDYEDLLAKCSSPLRLALGSLYELVKAGESCGTTSRKLPVDYHKKLIDEIFSLPERVARGLSKRVVMIYDNFEHLLELSNYKELKAILSTVSKIMDSHKSVSYVISGNQSLIQERIVKNKAFFRRRFNTIDLLPLDRESTYLLTSLFIGERGTRVPREILSPIHRFSMGIPLYVKALCEKALAISAERKESLSPTVVARAFVEEVLHRDGQIYNHCHSKYYNGLSLVSGSNSLKAILQILACEEGLVLAEIGRRIHRSNGQVHGYLKSLVNADLISLRGRKYYYTDPLLRFFVAQTFFSHFEERPSDNDVLRCGGLFIREFLCNRHWLPYALYDRIESIASAFDGSTVEGSVFGTDKRIRLPYCSSVESLVGLQKKESEETVSKLMVSDLWIRGRRSHWIVEIAVGDELFTMDDYAKVREKRVFFERSGRIVFDRLWVVSETGFTEEFLEEAAAAGILCSCVRDDLESILAPENLQIAA